MPRKLSVAVTTAAIPAVMMSALVLAEPAQAAPVGPNAALSPQVPLQAIKNLTAGTANVAAPSQLAAQIPFTIATESSVPATHRIEAGDTASSIAVRYGVSLDEVLRVNNLQSSSLIFAGEELRLPAGGSSAASSTSGAAAGTYTVEAGDTLSGIASSNGVGLESVLAVNGLTMTSVIMPGQEIALSGGSASAAAPASAAAANHTVEAGDTLTGIAARHGVSVAALMSANGMDESTVLFPGDVVVLSGGAGVTTLAAAPAEAAPADLVPNTFLHYTYPDDVVADANVNKQALNGAAVPGQAEMQQIVAQTAAQMGVDPALAMAFSFQESGFDQRAVSPANAIGAMQVIPSSGDWASDLVGRQLNLLDPYDNATAGVAIISSLMQTSDSLENAVASYYQGQYSVTTHGMFEDTRGYVASVLAHRESFS
ncbi:LysM peptidoglycan-binding domain-containing protein [Arthrobacter sp. zg-Y820]|uniref:LysM peptidoglycan-binding domain-containing protein n=1 Tax=unclassified Arthrobacter TaxID=235627 RepID=UPI001E615F68|nr:MULTISPECIES: LysM peptidoglycan-binding domain-containing protein [unclassified Arthrobacter]MCC9197879.1 LysM peptidoglycan-binding domain-containing protein [Arthrobacter sp. zg-Y820]MDK1280746.1 LysM peptidoglycan-binding domain-containing protein [Arthrobacter sp. zg.Y820]WIB10626.1 LysM peptidoglycan-binding domain-containing protein [Arthrobacter sp. zg-Y820]